MMSPGKVIAADRVFAESARKYLVPSLSSNIAPNCKASASRNDAKETPMRNSIVVTRTCSKNGSNLRGTGLSKSLCQTKKAAVLSSPWCLIARNNGDVRAKH